MQGMRAIIKYLKRIIVKLLKCTFSRFLESREWIAPATALYFLKNIVENYHNFSEILRDVEINIVPVANPDGYKHTFTTVIFI